MIVDTNIVIALLNTRDPFHEQVTVSYVGLRAVREAYFNAIIFAELAARAADRGALAGELQCLGLRDDSITLEDAWLGGKAFGAYRDNRGPRTTILPDFLIGAQAAVRGWPILTRDPKRFASYFPEVELIDPLKVHDD